MDPPLPKFGSDVKTRDVMRAHTHTHIQCMKSFITHIMRLSVGNKAVSKKVQKWLEGVGGLGELAWGFVIAG